MELTLQPRALEIQDLVVLTLLFEEKQHRMMEGGGRLKEAIQKIIVGQALAIGGGAGVF